MKQKHWIVFASCCLFIIACSKSTDFIANNMSFVGFNKPANFPQPTYNFANNNVTKAGFELGRTLFYESRLSRNNTISCGSCHIQSSSFTQHGHDVSHGIDDRLGTRNSPPIMNLAWSKAFMWGGGVYDLDLQPIVPITAHEEMDESLEHVMSKLSLLPKYQQLFKAAYGAPEITTAKMMKALSQFMLMCISSDSKYDQIMRKEQNMAFNTEEKDGFLIFKQKCASCHTEPLFTDGTFRNNGIPPSVIDDQGLYEVTMNQSDRYKFKVPSLRNLRYTAPYMHDGRFLTLEAVLAHYEHQVTDLPNLDPLLKEEKSKVLAFLNTLNDEKFINNPLLAEQ